MLVWYTRIWRGPYAPLAGQTGRWGTFGIDRGLRDGLRARYGTQAGFWDGAWDERRSDGANRVNP